MWLTGDLLAPLRQSPSLVLVRGPRRHRRTRRHQPDLPTPSLARICPINLRPEGSDHEKVCNQVPRHLAPAVYRGRGARDPVPAGAERDLSRYAEGGRLPELDLALPPGDD